MKSLWRWIIIVAGISDVISLIYIIRRGMGKTIDFLEGMKPWHDDLAIFLLVAINVIVFVFKYDWFARKGVTLRLVLGFETPLEKQDREQKIVQAKWDEERRKRQEARDKREFLVHKLIKNADVVWRLLNRDKGINPPYSELHEKCETITKISLTELKKYDFKLPDVLTVPIIGTDGPPRLSPENERFYKKWGEFCLYIVPFIQGEEEDRVQNIWYEKFDKN